ncbi:MAG: YdeI/OmpD-associated family protein [Bacteroidetes bacterium]|nr:YdeI/OmpD-associated family protein [Bacteroidota bacterium]
MPNTDKRIGAYISQSADFAKPILNHFRSLVHKTCPEVEETMKWSFPHFDYKGMMCSMAAFKQHCAFNFWKAALLKDGKKLLENREEAMGSFGRITSLKDLPSDKIIIGYIKEAMLLNEKNLKVQKPKVANNKELMVPQYLSDSFKKNKKALSTFENFSTSNKKEYINWITEAKTEETRKKRLAQAVEWMEEGKIKNWKYIK